MLSVKPKGDAVLVSVSAGGKPVHRMTSIEDAEDFLADLEEAIEEASC